MIKNQITEYIKKSLDLKQKLLLDESLLLAVEDLAIKCLNSLRKGGKIIFAGNGGSFGDSQHISAEFTSRFLFDRAPLASIALGTNSSAITAIGNDYGFDQVFSRELMAIGKIEDIFIPITTSGNSENIISAINTSNSLNIETVCLTGNHGGKIKNICDCIIVPCTATERIQECHILIGHIICAIVEHEYFKSS